MMRRTKNSLRRLSIRVRSKDLDADNPSRPVTAKSEQQKHITQNLNTEILPIPVSIRTVEEEPPRPSYPSRCFLMELPVELLHKIYWYSLEPALFHSSKSLSSILSSEPIYLNTIIHAFCNLNQQYDGSATHVARIFEDSEWPSISSRRQTQIQTCVLTSPWCTLERMEAALARMRVAITLDYLQTKGFELSREYKANFITRLENPISKNRPHINPFNIDIKSLDNATGRIVVGKSKNSIAIKLWGSELNPPSATSIRPFHFDVLPSLLLSKPFWTAKRLKLLYTICCNTRLRCDENALHRGMSHAIHEENTDALLVLCWISKDIVSRAATIHHTTAAFGNLPYQKPTVNMLPAFLFLDTVTNYNPTSHKPLSIGLDLFKLLLRCSPISMPVNNEILLAWARWLQTGHFEDGERLGQWIENWSGETVRQGHWLSQQQLIDTGLRTFGRDVQALKFEAGRYEEVGSRKMVAATEDAVRGDRLPLLPPSLDTL